jgi:hypothetical protein
MAAEAILAARSVHESTTRAVDAVQLIWEAFRHQDLDRIGAAERLLRHLRAHAAPDTPAHQLVTSVGDLLSGVRTMLEDAVPFTDRAMREINSLFDKGIELLECGRDALVTDNRVLVRHVLAGSAQYAQLASDYAMAHQQRLVEGVCLPQASAVYLGLLDHLKAVGHEARRIAEELALRHGPAPAAR